MMETDNSGGSAGILNSHVTQVCLLFYLMLKLFVSKKLGFVLEFMCKCDWEIFSIFDLLRQVVKLKFKMLLRVLGMFL